MSDCAIKRAKLKRRQREFSKKRFSAADEGIFIWFECLISFWFLEHLANLFPCCKFYWHSYYSFKWHIHNAITQVDMNHDAPVSLTTNDNIFERNLLINHATGADTIKRMRSSAVYDFHRNFCVKWKSWIRFVLFTIAYTFIWCRMSKSIQMMTSRVCSHLSAQEFRSTSIA